jgi:hypothetical protein
MRTYALKLVLIFQAVLLAAFAIALGRRWFPLGVRGEWEWPRIRVVPSPIDVAIAVAGLAAYALFAALGSRALAEKQSPVREGAWLTGLFVAAVGVQVVVQSGAPVGYGLTKWVTLGMRGSSGYYTVAKRQIDDPWRFWAEYPTWIQRQDALHVGTHPPGLFLWARAALGVMRTRPGVAAFVVEHLPATVNEGFRLMLGPLPRADRAALAVMGAAGLLACAATVVPLYLLGRWSGLPTAAAWAAASLWPVVPSAILFQPTADTAFPLLATTALALASRRRPWAAFAAGACLGVGTGFTLAFLAVGLVTAMVLASRSWRSWLLLTASTGAGFLAVTLATWAVSGANPFVIWWWNQEHHARFYVEYPRSYLAWVVANPIELAVGLGLAPSLWAAIGLASRRAPRVAWATVAVLAVLTLSGRSLSEVARLWLPLMPPLVVAAGAGLERTGGKALALAVTIGLVGLQTILLEQTIQVVYPV